MLDQMLYIFIYAIFSGKSTCFLQLHREPLLGFGNIKQKNKKTDPRAPVALYY